MPLSKDEMVDSVKAQIKLWIVDPGQFAYNTSHEGKTP